MSMNMSMKMKLVYILFVLLVSPAGAANPRTPGSLHSTDFFNQFTEITIACPMGGPPDSYLDDKGRLAGYVIDLWRLWSEKTGISIRLIPVSWQPGVDRVCSGELDVFGINAQVGDSGSCLENVVKLRDDFDYYFYRKGVTGINSIKDLKGFVIGVVEGRPDAAYIREVLPGAVLKTYPNAPALFDAAKRKEIVVFLNTFQNTLWWLKQYGINDEFDLDSRNPLFTVTCHVATRDRDSGLADAIRRGMGLITDGERAAIERKWLGQATVKTEDTLIISMDLGYAPMTFLDTEGRPAGLLVDIWKLWSEKNGQDIEFHPGHWDSSVNSIRTGTADVHSGLFFSEDRAEWMAFSQPFYGAASHFFYPAAAEGKWEAGGFAPKRVGAIRGSYQESYLRKNVPITEVVPFISREAMIRASLNGEIDSFLEEHHPVKSELTRLGLTGKLKADAAPAFVKTFHAGMLKGNPELLSMVDKGFDAISNRELADIEAQWIPNPEKRFCKPGVKCLRLTAAETEWINTQKTVKAGISPGFPPFLFFEDNTWKGTHIDYFNLIAERTGLDFEWVPAHPSTWDRMAEAGEIDLFPSFDIPERRARMSMTRPFMDYQMVIITRMDTSFMSGVGALRGRTVAVIKGGKLFDLIAGKYPGIQKLQVNSILEGLEAVSDGRADAMVSGLLLTSYLIQKHHLANLKIAGLADYPYKALLFAVRRDMPQLTGILNKAIDTITETEHEAILRKWFQIRVEYRPNWTVILKWAVGLSSLFVGIIAMTLYWNRRLSLEVNERKRAEAKLQLYSQHLEEMVEARTHELKSAHDELLVKERLAVLGHFAGSISHELRNPLAAIDSAGYLLKMKLVGGDDTILTCIKRIQSNVKKSTDIIQSLLNLSRMEKPKTKPRDLAGLIQEAVHSSRIPETVDVVTDIPEAPISVPVDADQLRMALKNIITNAVQAMAGEGTLTLAARPAEDGHIEVRISDTGPGIPAEQLDKIFEPLFTTKAQGIGFGLSITKMIIENHGGTIRAETAFGGGAKIIAVLPIAGARSAYD